MDSLVYKVVEESEERRVYMEDEGWCAGCLRNKESERTAECLCKTLTKCKS